MNVRNDERGFTMVTLLLLLAVAAVAGLVTIELLEQDHHVQRFSRQHQEAFQTAEGGLMEVINDQEVMSLLPTTASADLRVQYTPRSDSAFFGSSRNRSAQDYEATVELVRVVPMTESSHSVVRAVVYEARVDAEVAEGKGAASLQAEVYKVSSTKTGLIQPRVHAR